MILKTIIDRLNQRIEVSNIFDRIYGLCELTGDKGWIYYIGDGQAIPVTDYDSKQGSLFWAKRGKVNISKIDSLKVSGCKQMYSTKFNLSAYAIVRKSHLPCDGEDAGDWVASRVYKLVSGRDYGFKEVIDVVSYEVIPNGYTVGDKSLPPNFEFATVVIDLEVEIVSGSEDTCYDICNTGDIPLPPDFLPCTPCLTEVAVDGVTIIGNGTPADPLIAVGGGGGGSLTVRDEGTIVATGVVNMNFRGGAVNANSSTPGSVNIDVQEVQLTAGTGISVSGTYPTLTITNTSPSSGGTVTSVAATVPNPTNPAFSVNVPNNTTTPSVDITANGTTSQYVRGDGSLDTFPTLTGYVPYTGATQDVDLGTHKISVDAVEFSLTPTNSPAAGQIAYVGNTGALAYNMNGSAVTSQIGQTMHAFVNNADSVTITKGQAVYLFGASGNKASVKLANNTGDSTSAKTFGLAAEDITSGQNGFITVQGVLDGLNTGAYTAGDTLYLGATAGSLTNVKPYAPNHLVYVGVVEKANNGNGQIYVRVQNGYELDEIHDVDLITTPPVNKDLLTYVTGTPNLWKNQSLGTILGGTTSQYVRGDGSLATFPTGIPVVYRSTTDGTASNAALNTLSASQLVPANTFAVGDIIRVTARARKVGAASNLTIRLYANTSNSLTGATLLGTFASAGLMIPIQRHLAIKSATNTEGHSATTSLVSDISPSSVAVTSSNIDWTQAQYIIFAVQNGASADSSLISYYTIEKL